jgi:hypothetical protein
MTSSYVHSHHIYHGQPYARVDLDPYARVDFIPQSGTLDLASNFHRFSGLTYSMLT